MKEPHERLQEARIAAKYPDAATAARAIGAPVATYQGHENGSRGLSRAAQRYADFFHVSIEWLLTGKGEMRGRTPERQTIIPVDGLVGAGAVVEQIGKPETWGTTTAVTLPAGENLRALEVEGDSQLPRHFPGDFILYDKTPRIPGDLVDQYAIVDTLDGRRLLKIIRRGLGDLWLLESLNGEPELTGILAAYEYCGTIAKAAQSMPKGQSARPKKPHLASDRTPSHASGRHDDQGFLRKSSR
jgi:phage repressor protein C with HTH and peptisase S24 domain